MIFKQGNTVTFGEEIETSQLLEKGIYRLDYDRRKEQYFLVKKPDFKLPKKLYGDHSITSRWLKSANTYGKTGILLTGPAGTGKTVTAVKFCIESELPVIIIDENHSEGLLDFLSKAELGRCIIFIDEFEKIYQSKEQNVFLSILDGQYSSDLIFLLTINDEDYINPFLKNRLGRIKFKKEYTFLTEEEALEIIEDLLQNKSYKEELLKEIIELGIVTVDILKHMINEINLQEILPKEVVKMLCLYPQEKKYTLFLEYDGSAYEVSSGLTVDRCVDTSFYLPKELKDVFTTKRDSIFRSIDDLKKEGNDYIFTDVIDDDIEVSYRLVQEESSPYFKAL